MIPSSGRNTFCLVLRLRPLTSQNSRQTSDQGAADGYWSPIGCILKLSRFLQDEDRAVLLLCQRKLPFPQTVIKDGD